MYTAALRLQPSLPASALLILHDRVDPELVGTTSRDARFFLELRGKGESQALRVQYCRPNR